MKGKDIVQSCHLLILQAKRLQSRMRGACHTGREWELGLSITPPDSQALVFSTTYSAGFLGVMDSLENLLNSVDSHPQKKA